MMVLGTKALEGNRVPAEQTDRYDPTELCSRFWPSKVLIPRLGNQVKRDEPDAAETVPLPTHVRSNRPLILRDRERRRAANSQVNDSPSGRQANGSQHVGGTPRISQDHPSRATGHRNDRDAEPEWGRRDAQMGSFYHKIRTVCYTVPQDFIPALTLYRAGRSYRIHLNILIKSIT